MMLVNRHQIYRHSRRCSYRQFKTHKMLQN
jgi:hypothetical protein